MKVVHSWLKDYLGDALPEVSEVEELLTKHAFEIDGVEEVAGESVIDVDVLPNRSSDCLSHRGVARELASILDVSLASDPLTAAITIPEITDIKISVADEVACPRFTAVLMEGIEIKESPAWLKARLEALGQRSINNIVDATNYVMFALGQPMHAYDADKIPKVDGVLQIGVRMSKEGETVNLLGESGSTENRTIELQGTELLIVDGNDVPVGLAGIKGGRFAELGADTKNIILEAAYFHPTVIRKTARRLGILTDASKRFENEPSVELPGYAQQMIVELIAEIAGGTVRGMAEVRVPTVAMPEVMVTKARVNKLLGSDLSIEEIAALIARVGAKVDVKDDTSLAAVSPWERNDLKEEVDYIEEVGRLYGLDHITSVVPTAILITEVNPRQYYTEKIRQALLEIGFSEVITSSFAKKADIQLMNSLASDKSYVRKTLMKNIEAVLDANYIHSDLLGMDGMRVFEIGTVFEKTEDGIGEYTALTIGARLKGNGYNQKDDVVQQAGIAAAEAVLGAGLSWKIEKGVAELNVSEVLKNLPVPEAYDAYEKSAAVTYRRPSAYPAMSRDIALWVAGGEAAAAVKGTLTTAAGPLLVRDTLFDTFEKDGRTSYAFRFVFQSMERTLTDEEINGVMDAVYAVAKEKDWEVR
ncbi:MAG: phenylalanine--tRNA ligase subunit beta [Candidatus Nomurabacteria bacterium]|nr:MAG: phenylalanine--tRNA ligase subunit beta [Candidatus Nomurabacteria bacterium]